MSDDEGRIAENDEAEEDFRGHLKASESVEPRDEAEGDDDVEGHMKASEHKAL